MTQLKKLKKLKKAIRARVRKTGESYTSARRQVLFSRQKQRARTATAAAPSPAARPKSLTKGAISDEAVRKKTGHGLDHWFAVLDAFGAANKGHTGAAEHLYSVHRVPGWHAQGITVAYERARGLRQMNQSCSGKFQVSVSKTVPASVSDVVKALRSPRRRSEWLRGADLALSGALNAAFEGDKPREVRTKGTDYAWLRYRWDGSTVEIRITGKPKGSNIVADNEDLPEASQVEERRAKWRVALDHLLQYLSR